MCGYIDVTHLISQRVGVSRSATIVIAYLMAHDDMSLMDAYLMTRASRLNGENCAVSSSRNLGHILISFPRAVLIQPSLLFLREALHLESDLCRKRGKPLHFKNRWTWPALCRDIVRVLVATFLVSHVLRLTGDRLGNISVGPE